MKKTLKSLLTEGKQHISVGSFCILVMSIIYGILIVLAFTLDKKMPLDGYEFAAIVGALYGVKKFSQVIGKRKSNDDECSEK